MRYLDLTPSVAKFFSSNILSAPPHKGFSTAETRLAFRIADKVEPLVTDGGMLALEDQEYGFAKQWLEEQRFVHAFREIIELSDVIEKAPSENPAAAIN